MTISMYSFRKKALLIVCMVWTVSAWTCDVPVFRYALEVWPPDSYDVIVYHREPLTSEHQEVLDKLNAHAQSSEGHTNIASHLVNLNSLPEDGQNFIWQGQPEPELPWMIVRYPKSPPNRPHMWSGTFSGANSDLLVDSPKRLEIGQRLVKGDTAVWVLLESGNKEKDDAVVELLLSELDTLNKTLKLPELTVRSSFGQAKKIPPPRIDINFSLLRLSRTDAKEEMFVQMLLGSESDLARLEEPMVFPIYGRGRVLYALIGAGINKSNIKKGCYFIVGPCTCEIKDLSTGTDMLMRMDWEGSLDKTWSQLALTPVLPSLSDVKAAIPRPPDPKAIDTKSIQEARQESEALKRNIVYVIIASVIVIIVASAVLLIKKEEI